MSNPNASAKSFDISSADSALALFLRDYLRPTERVLCGIIGREEGKDTSLETRLFASIISSSQGAGSACLFLFSRPSNELKNIATTTRVEDQTAAFKFLRVIPLDHTISSSVTPAELGSQSSVNSSKDVIQDPTPSSISLVISQSSNNLLTLKCEISASGKLDAFLKELKGQVAKAVKRNSNIDLAAARFEWTQYYKSIPKVPIHVQERLSGVSLHILESHESLSQDFGLFDTQPRAYWVAQEMRRRESDYVNYRELQIFSGTWNVKGTAPSDSLASWLFETVESRNLDIYALGFQELDDSTEAYLVSDDSKEKEWIRQIREQLPENTYKVVVSKRLIGIWLVIFAKSSLNVKLVGAENVAVGLLGMLGNKGGVGARLQVEDSILTFVNCHLASDTAMELKRNQDYIEISKRLAFPVPAPFKNMEEYMLSNPWLPTYFESAPGLPKENNPLERRGKGQTLSIFETDHLIWMGDLNYRVTVSEPEAKVLLAQDPKQLLEFDQLKKVIREKSAFTRYCEGDIDFPPTYKYDIGSSNFDSSEKRRAPSWCDRILYFPNPLHHDSDLAQGRWILNDVYTCDMNTKQSDHKPVAALFCAKIRSVDWSKAWKETDSIVHGQFDKLENHLIPDLSVSSNVIAFPVNGVRFSCPVTQTIVLENKGLATAHFKFIPKLEETAVSKRWVHLNPSRGSLDVGERIVLRATLLLDRETCLALNYGRETLDDIIILHVDNGKDMFLSVSGGDWSASCYGNYLAALCRRSKSSGFREPWHASEEKGMSCLAQSGASPSTISAQRQEASKTFMESIPHELWRLADYILRHGMDVEMLFRTSGYPDTRVLIQKALDAGSEFDDLSKHAILNVQVNLDSTESTPGVMLSPDISRAWSIQDLILPDLLGSPSNAASQSIAERPAMSSPTANLLDMSNDLMNDMMQPVLIPERADPLVRKIRMVHTMAECMLLFLDSLAEAVIPLGNFKKCVLEGYISAAAAKLSLDYLPVLHYNILVYIVSFLQEIGQNYKVDNPDSALSLNFLASTFSRVMCRIPPELMAGQVPPAFVEGIHAKRTQFLLFLLEGGALV